MWPAFLIGLLSELFDEAEKPETFLLKGLASGLAGMILNLALLLLIARQASSLIGYDTPTLTNITLEFLLVPLVAAFVGLIIIKLARFFSNFESFARAKTV